MDDAQQVSRGYSITSMQLSLYFVEKQKNPELIGQKVATNVKTEIPQPHYANHLLGSKPDIMLLHGNVPYDTSYIFYPNALGLASGMFMQLSSNALHFAYKLLLDPSTETTLNIFKELATIVITQVDVEIARIGIIGTAIQRAQNPDKYLLENILNTKQIKAIPHISGKKLSNIAFRANSKDVYKELPINNVISVWAENGIAPLLCHSLDINTDGIGNNLTKEFQLDFFNDKCSLYAFPSFDEVFQK